MFGFEPFESYGREAKKQRNSIPVLLNWARGFYDIDTAAI
jgi:hypothetical protein